MTIDKNSIWRHNGNGRFYKVLCIANSNRDMARDDFPELVVYQSIPLGEIWARPIDVFLSRCTEEI